MKKLVQVVAAIAVLSTGVVKGEEAPSVFDTYNQCLNQAKSAWALVHAREQGKSREDVKNYVKSHEQAIYHPMLFRIVDKVYDNPKLGNQAAYDGELVFCMQKNVFVVK